MKKVVLNEAGYPWGSVDVPAKVRKVSCFLRIAENGEPKNIMVRKVSSNKKLLKQLEKKRYTRECFTEYEFEGETYFKCSY